MSSHFQGLLFHLSLGAQTALRVRRHVPAAFIQTTARRNFLLTVGLFLFVALALQCGTAQTAVVNPDTAVHNIKTVFVILMENHNWTRGGHDSLKNNELAPYINHTLVPQASLAGNYFNPPNLHPSLPNYLWLEAGTNFGIRNNRGPLRNHQATPKHLVTLLEDKGISWKSYDERSGGILCPIQYWHVPFVFFDDVTDYNNPWSTKCVEHIRPVTELEEDLRADKVARYNFIVPNVCDSMHTQCGRENQILQGDKWLARIVPQILRSSAFRRDGVLIITFDEGGTGDGPVPLLVLSPLAKGYGYTNYRYYTHSSTLRTIQEIFGVYPLLGDAARQEDLRDLFITFP